MVDQYQSERRKEFGEFMNLTKIASHLRKPLGYAQDETTPSIIDCIQRDTPWINETHLSHPPNGNSL
jgi:hypothetical protein